MSKYRINVRFDLDKPMEENAAKYLQELLDAERKTEMEHNNLTRKKERKIER